MTDREIREIRLNPIVHAESVLVATASYLGNLDICLRTSIPTGFELGSGLFVNTISPEIAARKLRAVVLED